MSGPLGVADATPVIVHTHMEDGFKIHARAIIDAMTPKTRAIIINSPCNPTGALISEDDMIAIADAAAARGIWIIADVTYEKLVYDVASSNLIGILFERMRNGATARGKSISQVRGTWKHMAGAWPDWSWR